MRSSYSYCLVVIAFAAEWQNAYALAVQPYPPYAMPSLDATSSSRQNITSKSMPTLSFSSTSHRTKGFAANLHTKFPGLRQIGLARQGKAIAHVSTTQPNDPDDEEDRQDTNMSEATGGVDEDSSADSPNKHSYRFTTVLTLAGVSAHNDLKQGRKTSIAISQQDAAWLKGQHFDAAYYAPTKESLVRMAHLLASLHEICKARHTAFHLPTVIALANLAPDRISPTKAWHASSSDSRNMHAKYVEDEDGPRGQAEAIQPESAYEFIKRTDDALSRIIGRETLEAQVHKSIVTAGAQDYNGTRPQHTAQEHTSHVLIVADQIVLNTIVRRLLSLGHWEFEQVRKMLDQRMPDGSTIDDPWGKLMQFKIEDVDLLPQSHGVLSTAMLAQQGRELNISSWTWKRP